MEATFSQFRFYVYTRLKLSIPAKEVFNELQVVWGDQAPSYAVIRKWKVEFKTEARSSFEDTPRSGRPKSTRTDAMIQAVKEAIEDDPKLSTRDIAMLLQVDHMTVHRILDEDLLLRNVCSVWVPHCLTATQAQLRVTCAKQLRRILHSLESSRYDAYAVADETWIHFDPQHTKADDRVWIKVTDPRPQVVRPSLTLRKTMLLVAFTPTGRFSVCATEPNETVDSDKFIEFVRHTGDKWRNLRCNPIYLSEIQWQMDNARPHKSGVTQQFLENRGVTLVWQSPYSPDMNLCDRFLLKLLKAALREKTFQSHSEVEKDALHFLRSLPEELLQNEVECLYDHCQAIINVGGAYVTD